MIAHRGSSGTYAEHTRTAYRSAIEEGADGLECDVRLTADGYPVLVHDRRIDRTSDGQGVVSTMTLKQLDERDYASWKRSGIHVAGDEPLLDPSHKGVLTLNRLLDLVLEADRPIDLSIETKHPVRYAGMVEQKVAEVLTEYGLDKPVPDGPHVRVMSFSETALRRVRLLLPGVPTVYLMDRVPIRARSGWLPAGARIAGPSIKVLSQHPHYVERMHSAGIQVHVWTVDEPADIDLCIAQGVDGIITNRPAEVLRRLGNR